MSDSFPVTVAVRRSDGSTEQVRIGTATRSADGFRLNFDALTIATEGPGAARPAARAAGGELAVFPNYGRSKGMPIAGAAMQDLEFYANGARRTLADPGKARFHDKERVLLAAIEVEMARQGGSSQGGGGGMPDDTGIPPHGDDDRGGGEPF